MDALLFKLQIARHELPEKIWTTIAWVLPRKLVYWCAIRLMSEASCGKFSDRHPDDISVIDALDAWGEAEEEAG